MYDYITQDELKELRKSMYADRDELVEYKKRGKGVKYIPKHNKHNYILLTYTIHILDRLITMTNKGDYLRGRIVEALAHQDWKLYSFSDKAFHGNGLFRVLMVEPKDPMDKLKHLKQTVELMELQAEYLKEASYLVITNIEGEF